LSYAYSIFTVATKLHGKVEQLFRIQQRINPPSSSGFPADRRAERITGKQKQGIGPVDQRVIGEVREDVKLSKLVVSK
jgi:hypothetical protein